MPTNKIKENNIDIKKDYYQNIDLKETIKNAKSLLEMLSNGEYQGLVKTPILEPINIENGNKDDELIVENDDERKQRLLREGFFAVPAWPDKNNKLKYGGEFKIK